MMHYYRLFILLILPLLMTQCRPRVVTMTTAQSIGDSIQLYFDAEHPESVSILGLEKTSEEGLYLMTSQSIQIQGDLTGLACWNGQLTSLDVSQLSNLEVLSCSNNRLSSLDISRLVNLTGLDCSDNQLSTLDLSQLTKLHLLDISDNNFSSQELLRICEALPDRSGLSEEEQGEIRLINPESSRVQPEISNQILALLTHKGWRLKEAWV